MFKILFALHLLTAIFAIGPLVHAATTAARGLRQADAGATATSARTITIYSYVSVLVVVLGFGVMSSKRHGHTVAEFSEAWIWVSALLWLVAVGIALALVVPALQQATTRITVGEAVDSLTARVAAGGGVIGLIFAGIVFLMVYKPGR
ncbi:MAG: hypothetical protein J7518_19875 [Nocardioidaceae bacterium]|nr:hypothetical protein [Nocardioidaceae bacterium]